MLNNLLTSLLSSDNLLLNNKIELMRSGHNESDTLYVQQYFVPISM